jgi:CrcB protein
MRHQLEAILLIGVGGFVGANVRYWISGVAAERFGPTFPWGTMIINVTGSCLLAVFLSYAASHIEVDARWRLLIGTGFFGAYTTFSTYAVDSAALYDTGHIAQAIGNILGTNALCLLGAALGLLVGSKIG